MISEHTAAHTPRRLMNHTSSVRVSAVMRDAVECPGGPSTSARQRLLSIALAVLHALAVHGNPSFFEFERRPPEHHRLGPGVSRVSDSFWPLTDW